MCSSLDVSSLIRHKSDHFPILLDFETSYTRFMSQFKFLNMWTLHEGCRQVIQDSWNTNVVGCPMFVLNQKLKIFKQNFKVWNKNVFGNVHLLVKDAEQKLNVIQNEIDCNGINDVVMEHQKLTQIQLEQALVIEEEFWKEKANVTWHSEGDRNTKYFHRLSKIKHTSKLITTIKDGDNMLSDPEQITTHITNHFHNLFSTNSVV